jgi:hypothetical protein
MYISYYYIKVANYFLVSFNLFIEFYFLPFKFIVNTSILDKLIFCKMN